MNSWLTSQIDTNFNALKFSIQIRVREIDVGAYHVKEKKLEDHR